MITITLTDVKMITEQERLTEFVLWCDALKENQIAAHAYQESQRRMENYLKRCDDEMRLQYSDATTLTEHAGR